MINTFNDILFEFLKEPLNRVLLLILSCSCLLFFFISKLRNFYNDEKEELQLQLKIKLLTDKAKPPNTPKSGDAGFDIFSCIDVEIPPHKRIAVSTGIAVEIPEGYYGRISDRSSMSLKYLDIKAGIIDSTYRNEILVIIHNEDDKPYIIKTGDKITQMIISPYATPKLVLVDELSRTERKGGFGSTGSR